MDMSTQPKDKVALSTGGSSGIGRAAALALTPEGARCLRLLKPKTPGSFGDRVSAGFAPSLTEGEIQFMKSLRMFVLTLAVGVFPVFLMHAHGQQEVDPDHFDPPPAAKANVYTVKAPTNHNATAADHQARKHASTASKHTGRKPNQHQVQASQDPFVDRVPPSASVEFAEARIGCLPLCK